MYECRDDRMTEVYERECINIDLEFVGFVPRRREKRTGVYFWEEHEHAWEESRVGEGEVCFEDPKNADE
jgi:hypothetical protein